MRRGERSCAANRRVRASRQQGFRHRIGHVVAELQRSYGFLSACAFLAAVAGLCMARPARAEDDGVVVLTPVTVGDTRPARAPFGAPDILHETATAADPAVPAALPTLAASLAGLPGVIAQESFGGFEPPRISLRGSGLQSAPVSRGIRWSLDGLPLNAADGSFRISLEDHIAVWL